MQDQFRPHTRTHTFAFRGCRRLKMLLSSLGEEKINEMFAGALERAGFQIVKDAAGNRRIQCHPFGEKYGYTATAILTSSDAAIHTYPEKEFGYTLQLKLNLCYLWPATEQQHEANLEKVGPEIQMVVNAREVSRTDTHPEYLRR